jgi:hypothetical protein
MGARYLLLSINMTERCCYLLYLSLSLSFSLSLLYRSRALPYISYPCLSHRLGLLLPKHHDECSFFFL